METLNLTKGDTLFQNLYIGWYYSHDFGLSVTEIRCGVCKLPVQPLAIKVREKVYMTCTDGHLVGTLDDPFVAARQLAIAQKQGQVIRFTDRQTHNNRVFELIHQFKSGFDIDKATSEG